MKIGYGIVGYPGAGKSLAGEMLSEQQDAINIETGDIVREGAEEYFDYPEGMPISSHELGDYSTMRREEDGGDYVAQDVVTILKENEDFPERSAAITGMRDTSAPELFRDFFDSFTIIWIHANFNTRLRRLQQRGRQDEAGFTAEDLRKRDRREDNWGTGDLILESDEFVPNESAVDELAARLEKLM